MSFAGTGGIAGATPPPPPSPLSAATWGRKPAPFAASTPVTSDADIIDTGEAARGVDTALLPAGTTVAADETDAESGRRLLLRCCVRESGAKALGDARAVSLLLA